MPAAKKISAVKIRTACLEDYAQIAELECRYKLGSKTSEEWKHLWLDNPVYRKLGKSWPLGWVLEDSDRRIVGYIGNIPLSYEFAGTELLSASGRAWVVDSQYRSYSLLLMDHFLAQGNVDLYINTSLNHQAFDGFGVFGPLPVPVGDWDRSRFWITNPVGFLASLLVAKGIPSANFASCALSVPLFIKGEFAGGRFGKNGKQINVQCCSGFDERFDAFWECLKRSRRDVLLGKRTRETLEWHFRYALSRNDAWIFCISDGPRLVAYSIFYRQDSAKFGLKRIRLADFQSLADDSTLLLAMLSCALERCRCSGIHMLEIIGLCPEKIQAISKLAPYQRKLPSWLAFYKTSDPWLGDRLKNPRVWDLSLFDGDSSL
jgi:hypothetical protein